MIDDEPDMRRILELEFFAEGFETLTACNALDGLDLVCTESPAVVILDLMMPMKDGWWFLRELAGLGIERPSIIVLSARSGEAERLVARGLGVDEFVTKPFDIDHVLDLIRRHIRPERERDEPSGAA